MFLRNVREKSQFEDFYREKNLVTTEQRIKFLEEKMGVVFSCGEDFTPEEELSTLQQYALRDWDRREY